MRAGTPKGFILLRYESGRPLRVAVAHISSYFVSESRTCTSVLTVDCRGAEFHGVVESPEEIDALINAEAACA